MLVNEVDDSVPLLIEVHDSEVGDGLCSFFGPFLA